MAGHSRGHNAGLKEGRAECKDGIVEYTRGLAEGYNTGHSDGYDAGLEAGRAEGYTDGQDSGRRNGYSEGFAAAMG